MRHLKLMFWFPLVSAFAPILLGIVGAIRADRGDLFIPSAFILPIAFALTLWPVMLRVVHAPKSSLRASLQFAVLRAAQDMRGTAISTFRFALGVTVSLAAGSAVVWAFESYFMALLVTLVTIVFACIPAIHVLETRTKRLAPRTTSIDDLLRMGWMFAPATLAVITIAALATREPLPMHVITEGRGIQHVRGMLPELGERDRLSTRHFVVDVTNAGTQRDDGQFVVHIRPTRGAAYDVRSPFEPTYAGLRTSSCGTDCETVLVQGPDWSMSIELGEDGRRRDDTSINRVTTRVGAFGAAALAAITLVLLAMGIRIGRVSREMKRLTGANFRHQFAGTLHAESANIRDGVLVSSNASITILDGAVSLQLPESLALLAADEALQDPTQSLLTVLMHEQPEFATHRTGRVPLASTAHVILGARERIEHQALSRITARVVPQTAYAIAVIALLLSAMLIA